MNDSHFVTRQDALRKVESLLSNEISRGKGLVVEHYELYIENPFKTVIKEKKLYLHCNWGVEWK